ncbi:MAG: hypothetical protein ACQKBY_04370, partial [Verrucomicrobiales bacterium]
MKAIITSFVVTVTSATALQITAYDPADHDNYSSGYPGSPVRNTSDTYVGLGRDLSGLIWAKTNAAKSFGLLSPRHYLYASHYGGSSVVRAFGQTGGVVERNHSHGENAGCGMFFSGRADASLGTLTEPMPVSNAVGRYLVMDLHDSSAADSPANYTGEPVLVAGRGANGASSTRLAPGEIKSTSIYGGGTNSRIVVSSSYFSFQTGDSGSPAFIDWVNPFGEPELGLVGLNSAVTSTSNYISMVATTVGMSNLNDLMNDEGYALRVGGEPTSRRMLTDTDLRFENAANWSGAFPNDNYVYYNILEGSPFLPVTEDQNVRGLYLMSKLEEGMDPESASNPFSKSLWLGGDGELTIGRGGVTNDNAWSLQIQCAVKLGDSQHWSLRDLDVDLRDLDTNGNLLE